MKNFALVVFIVLAGIGASAQNPKVISDPNAQKRTVGDFHGIRVGGGFEVYLSQGNDEAVAVSADDPEIRNRIVTEVRDGILHIHLDDRFHWRWSWHNHKMKAYVSCKTLDQLKAAGGATIHIDETLKASRLEVHVAGGGEVRGKIEAEEVTVGISGGGDTYISGVTGQLDVHVSGGGDFHGYELAADNCKARVSGGGDIYLTVNKSLDASVSGGGDIRYKGNGSIREMHTNGGGTISKE